jgi:hypothetical protein
VKGKLIFIAIVAVIAVLDALLGSPLYKWYRANYGDEENDSSTRGGRRAAMVESLFQATGAQEEPSEEKVAGTWELEGTPQKLVLNSDGSFQYDLTFSGTHEMAGGLKYTHTTTCTATGVWWLEQKKFLALQVKKLTNLQHTEMKVFPTPGKTPPPVDQLRKQLPLAISKQVQADLGKRVLGGEITGLSAYGLHVSSQPEATKFKKL